MHNRPAWGRSSIKSPWRGLQKGAFLLLSGRSEQIHSLNLPSFCVQSSISTKSFLALTMQEPDGSSQGGGYYKYQCCYFYVENCDGYVHQNGDACPKCQVLFFPYFELEQRSILIALIGKGIKEPTTTLSVPAASKGPLCSSSGRTHDVRDIQPSKRAQRAKPARAQPAQRSPSIVRYRFQH